MKTINEEASDRCSDFIEAIIDVCREHRVLIRIDDLDAAEHVYFEEHSSHPGKDGWLLGIDDLEYNIRLELEKEFNGDI
jgi:hypothetical protein